MSIFYQTLVQLNIKWEKLFIFIYGAAVFIGIPVLFAGHESISGNEVYTSVSMFVLGFIFSFIAWIGFAQKVSHVSLKWIMMKKRLVLLIRIS